MPDSPLRTLVVDDEAMAIERMQVLLSRFEGVNLVGTASTGGQALRLIEALAPDLLLLDISMPGLDGIGVAQAVQRLPQRPAVVFVTAFDQYAVTAFDVAAADYLLKPVDPDRLGKALARVRELRANAPASPAEDDGYVREFWVPHRSEIVRVDVEAIEMIEAERDYMRLHTADRSFLLHQTIKELERRLDPDRFIRIHRSKIIRRDRIRGLVHLGYGVWSVDLGDGGDHRIGRTYLSDVKRITGK
ncbi:LytR/AlgR family response regulator transcription factor [Sphingosinicella microcystinivorans]|uniref:LytR/AlgR family response regulator transcription factor n=1 Tax=Sphingosinicella microcystinivorans TaxID=335406 RepID=UPI0022F3C5C6|nr:LytTR family DNA-binding domain-containing protein [Sphingosinicella microcystinivorans]WBX82995.1 LytTR family DNA-binding domain-containing protein [Sphingosinicella microcystinivorans]